MCCGTCTQICVHSPVYSDCMSLEILHPGYMYQRSGDTPLHATAPADM